MKISMTGIQMHLTMTMFSRIQRKTAVITSPSTSRTKKKHLRKRLIPKITFLKRIRLLTHQKKMINKKTPMLIFGIGVFYLQVQLHDVVIHDKSISDIGFYGINRCKAFCFVNIQAVPIIFIACQINSFFVQFLCKLYGLSQ